MKATADENVVLSFVECPDKATCDEGCSALPCAAPSKEVPSSIDYYVVKVIAP